MQDELIELLAGCTGHFQLESGFHSEKWFELNRLFSQPEKLRPFVLELGRRMVAHSIDAICGPMTGGATLAESIAVEFGLSYFFSERLEVPNATGLFPVRYAIPPGQRESVRNKTVAIVDDAISAGSAVRGTHADLLTCGARPVAVGALFVLGGRAARFAADNTLALEAVASLDFNLWHPSDCPLCRGGEPLKTVSDVA